MIKKSGCLLPAWCVSVLTPPPLIFACLSLSCLLLLSHSVCPSCGDVSPLLDCFLLISSPWVVFVRAGCVKIKTSKTLSFNDFDTSQIRWLCVCVCACLKGFHLLGLEIIESGVGYLVHSIIQCVFRTTACTHQPVSPSCANKPVQHLGWCMASAKKFMFSVWPCFSPNK